MNIWYVVSLERNPELDFGKIVKAGIGFRDQWTKRAAIKNIAEMQNKTVSQTAQWTKNKDRIESGGNGQRERR